MDILQRINKVETDYAEKVRELTRTFKTEFIEIIVEIMKKSDMINEISWHQYTPYFNDGDECTFRTSTDDLTINNGTQDDIFFTGPIEIIYKKPTQIEADLSNELWKKYDPAVLRTFTTSSDMFVRVNKAYNEKEYLIAQELVNVMEAIPDHMLQGTFGDHVEIVINREGVVTTSEYDHE